MSIVPSTIAATQGAKEGQAGLASGLVNTSRQVGGGLGLAVLVTLATQRTTHLIGAGEQVPQALTDGFRLAYLIGARPRRRRGARHVRRAAQPRARARAAPSEALASAPSASRSRCSSRSPPRSPARTARRSAPTRTAAPTASSPSPRCTRRSCTPSKRARRRRARAGLHLHGELLRPQLTADGRPERAADPRPTPAAGVVPAGARKASSPPTSACRATRASRRSRGGRASSRNTGATESGEDVVVNQHYQTVARLKATDGWVITLHELMIEGDDAWVTANKNIPVNLSRYGGAYNGALIDSAVQEYDLQDRQAAAHLGRARAHPAERLPGLAAHERLPLGRLPRQLDRPARQRHVPRVDAQHLGRLPGRHRHRHDRVDARRQALELQVRARAPRSSGSTTSRCRPRSTVTMFDDHCCQLTGGGTSVARHRASSRGLVLKLDHADPHGDARRPSTAAARASNPNTWATPSRCANGNVFVGWGSEPYFSEYSASGKLLFEGEFPRPDLSYRATLEPWVGLPLTAARRPRPRSTAAGRPCTRAGTAPPRSSRVEGAGRVERRAAERVVASAARSGFETAITVPRRVRELRVAGARRARQRDRILTTLSGSQQ